MRWFRIPTTAVAAVLSLSLAAATARAQGFFPADPAPPAGAPGAPAAPAPAPAGFGLGPAVGAAAATAPLATAVLGLGLALGLAAASGGGGDDGFGGGTITPLDGCTTVDTGRGAFETAEYHAAGGLGVICAADRYAQGTFGAGVNVGVFDDGFYTYHNQLRPTFGTTGGDNQVQVYDGYDDFPDWVNDGNHGTHVAGIIAAARDGIGMQGVAPAATLWGIRGISDYATLTAPFQGIKDAADNVIDPFEVMFSKAMIWAEGNGVEVMNHSWGLIDGFGFSVTLDDLGSLAAVENEVGTYLAQAIDASIGGGTVLDSVRKAPPGNPGAPEKDWTWQAASAPLAGGMVHVFSTGNSTLSEPGVFAGLPYFGGQDNAANNYADGVIMVTSVDLDGTISSFANRCGLAKDFCIAAPGGDIYSTVEQRNVYDAEGNFTGVEAETYDTYSGTSMAAPHVTGAIALLLREFDSLTAAEALTIVKETATDLGAPGVDEVYGHGLLNLSGAMAPSGILSIQMAATLGADARPAAGSGIVAQGGVARALASTLSAQPMIVTDRYARGFSVDAGAFVAEASAEPAQQDRVAAFAASDTRVLRLADAAGEVRFSPWGAEALAAPGILGEVHAPQLAVLSGGAALAWSAGLGDGLTGTLHLAGPVGAQAAGATDPRYLGGSLSLALGARAQVSLGAGMLEESGGFLGADLAGAFGGAVRSETAFLTLGAGLDLGGSRLDLSYTDGETGFAGDGVVRAGSGIGSRSIGLSWETAAGAGPRGGRLGLGLRRTLEVTGGQLDVVVPVARGAAVAGVASTGVEMASSSLAVDPAAAPTDIELRYALPLGPGQLGFALTHRVQEAADDGLVAGLGFRMAF